LASVWPSRCASAAAMPLSSSRRIASWPLTGISPGRSSSSHSGRLQQPASQSDGTSTRSSAIQNASPTRAAAAATTSLAVSLATGLPSNASTATAVAGRALLARSASHTSGEGGPPTRRASRLARSPRYISSSTCANRSPSSGRPPSRCAPATTSTASATRKSIPASPHRAGAAVGEARNSSGVSCSIRTARRSANVSST